MYANVSKRKSRKERERERGGREGEGGRRDILRKFVS
jgi:hypothetical protein